MFLVALYLLVTRNTESNDIGGLTVVLFLLGAPLIVLCNKLITKVLDYRLTWTIYKEKRFALQVILGLLISLGCINGLYIILKELYTDSAPDSLQLILINIYSALIIIPTISIYFGLKFLNEWNTYKLEAERLQKENAHSQMMSLRNHLDPHFLFNNLNILSSLIDLDVALSKKYLEKFAEVYRTILRSKLSDLTTLSEELQLMDAYTYLVKIRWKDALFIHTNIPDEVKEKAIPPLAAQMLIENAIKHNTISKSDPLHISIEVIDGNFLEISNTKNIKEYSDIKKTGTGLLNIKNRYEYFTEQSVEVLEDDTTFRVKLPLLTIE